ncbi:MAG: 3'-5' exonuclease, partial [Anaerovibrio sp.]|nr:3'-5' exonuclease [Anaerovibrio sp.]
ADFTVFDEADCLELVRSLARCQAYQENAMQALINLIKEYRGEYNIFTANSREDYEKVLWRLKNEKQQRINDAARQRGKSNQELVMTLEAHCGEIVSEYDGILRENHAVDFTDLLNGAYQLLQDASIASLWQRRFKFWSVDEVQDTSRLEYTILTMMFGENNLLLCGDFFQTIYEWRGSEPQLLYNRFAREYHPVLMVFHENYRSTQKLLKAGYGFLKKRFPEQAAGLFKEDALAKSPEEGEPIVHKTLGNTYIEANWIYNRLQLLQPEDLSQVCILTRSNYYNQKLSNALARIQQHRQEQWSMGQRQQPDFPLDFMLVDEFKFFRRQEIKDVMAALRLLLNPQDSTSLLRLLKRFGRRIGPAALAKLQSPEYKEAGIRLTDFLHSSAQKYAEPFEMLLRALEQGQAVVFDVEATGLDTARDEIIQLAAVKLDIHGHEQARLMRYLKAAKPVGSSEEIHHISDAKLAEEGIEPTAALQEFLDFARGCVIVGHNVVFDLTILASQLVRCGLPPLETAAFYDTLDIFRRFYPALPNHRLEFLGEYCQVEHKSSHDAFDDICATGEILLYAVRQNIVPSRDIRRTYISSYVKKFAPLAEAVAELREQAKELSLGELAARVIVRLGMNRYYARDAARLENLRSLVRQARTLDAQKLSHYDALQGFLRLAALSNTELDLMLTEHPRIPIITVHQAKGSEFETVFMAGLQEGVFPSRISVLQDNMEEEARLFYVGITRARKRLYLSTVAEKDAVPCRFINSIPKEYVQEDVK